MQSRSAANTVEQVTEIGTFTFSLCVNYFITTNPLEYFLTRILYV